MQSIEAALRGTGFDCFAGPGLESVLTCGEITRANRNGALNAWFLGKQIQLPSGHIVRTARWGDWKTDEKHEWTSQQAGLVPELLPEDRQALEAHAAQQWQEKQKRQSDAAGKAFEAYANAEPNHSHAYLRRKFSEPLPDFGQRLDRAGALLIPLRDTTGKIWSLQKIDPDGQKNFLPGGKIKGCFHTLYGDINNAREIYIAEGFATAATVAVALGAGGPRQDDRGLAAFAVVCGFNAGNLEEVAREARRIAPEAKIVICADNDAFTKRPNGSAWNPGLEKARKAALACQGEVACPIFVTPEPGFTDFNDLYMREGLERVRELLAALPEEDAPEGPGAGVPEPAPKKDVVSEKRVADTLLEHYGEDLVRQDKSLFIYDGRKWSELDASGIDKIKNQLNELLGNKLDSKKVNSIYATFVRYIPHVPENTNLFTPNKTCGNFLDGTLRLRRDAGTGKYALEFGPHDRRDFVTWVIPVNYQCDRGIKNAKFEKLLEAAFEGDPDKDGKIRSIRQTGGAMLMPAFAQLFFWHGASGARKSTIAKCFAKLLHLPNMSFVDPTVMEGFQIEGMLGKLVNMNTDIDDYAPLPRGFIKRFEDGLPFQVNRKGKTVVNATLPMVHLYCTNKLPPNFEGNGKALYRRLTLVEFTRDLTNDNRDGEIKYYEDIVFSEGYEGILNFMLEGLDDLVASGGKFAAPASSGQKMSEWQKDHDMVAQFLEAACAGELLVDDKNTKLLVNDKARIKPNDLWSCFKKFHLDTAPSRKIMGRNAFYAAMRDRAFCLVTIKGWPHYSGIGVEQGEGSGF